MTGTAVIMSLVYIRVVIWKVYLHYNVVVAFACVDNGRLKLNSYEELKVVLNVQVLKNCVNIGYAAHLIKDSDYGAILTCISMGSLHNGWVYF